MTDVVRRLAALRSEPSRDDAGDPARLARVERTRGEMMTQGLAITATLQAEEARIETLVRLLRDRPILRVVVAGCGDSWFIGAGVRHALERLVGVPLEAAQALDYAAYGSATADARTMVIGISASGETPAIVVALAAARRRGALTVGMSNRADGPIVLDADAGLVVHATRRGWPTQSSTAAMAPLTRLWLDHVGIVGLIPSNYPSHWLDRLRAGGLLTERIRIVDETVTCMEWLVYAADGSRADHLYAELDALDGLDLDQERLSDATVSALRSALRGQGAKGRSFGAFRHAHPVTLDDSPLGFLAAAGFHLAANRPDQQCTMARALSDGGRRVTLDPGSNAAAVARQLAAAPLRIDALLPSERELSLMAPDASMKDGLALLIGYGAGAAAVKCGASGALVQSSATTGPVHIPALPVLARDPTGAGDAFCGGFLAGLIRSGDPLLAACCGTVSASFAVEGPGPFHLIGADRAEARRRLATIVAALPPAVRPEHALSPSSMPS